MGTIKAENVDHIVMGASEWQAVATNYETNTALMTTGNPKIYTVVDRSVEPPKPVAHIMRKNSRRKKESWVAYPAPGKVRYKSVRHRVSQSVPYTESRSLGVTYSRYCGFLLYEDSGTTSP